SIFSSWVIVAPGHCSPSRKVVSKMTTRSFSDWVVVMNSILLRCAQRRGCLTNALIMSARGFDEPLSAQAHAPNRPSGADKKEVQNEGSGRQSLTGSRSDRAI